MSRRRQFEEPVVHAYWPHSDPEPADGGSSNPTAAPTEDPCPGPCNRAWRTAETAGSDHDEVMHPGAPVWCRDQGDHHGCTEAITKDLRGLFDLAGHLTPGELNTPRDVKADDRGMGSSGMVHPPTNSPAWDAADELIRWAVKTEDELRDRLGHDSKRGDTRRLLWPSLRYLTAYVTPLLSDQEASEAVGWRIMGFHRQLERNTGTGRLVHRLPGTCMVCDRKGLQRPDGGELVKCRHCGATWAWESYERLSKAYADDVRRRGA